MSTNLILFTILFVLITVFNSYNCQSNDYYSDCFEYCLDRFWRIRSRHKPRFIPDCVENCEQYYFYEENYQIKDYTLDYTQHPFNHFRERKKHTMVKYFNQRLPKGASSKPLAKFVKIEQPLHGGYKSKQDIRKTRIFGSREQVLGKIIGGADADPYEFPWMVSLQDKHNNIISHFCGGAIISDRFILTAAHCLENFINRERELYIKIGVNSFKEKSAQNITAEKIYVHAGWDKTTHLNDISIIKVRETIKFTTDNLGRYVVNVVCLPETADEPKDMAVLAGLGEVVFKAGSTEWLGKLNVPIIERGNCAKIFKEFIDKNVPGAKHKIENQHICAGGAIGKDACRGDSGGPLIQIRNSKAYHLGIVSFVIAPCATSGVPTIYANTIYFMDWINEKMKL